MTVALLGVAFLAHAGAAWRLEDRVSATTVMVGAFVLRAVLLPLPPTLSDDSLRYLWDGRVTAAGENPYRLAPDAAALAPLRDERWERMPHRQVATVYPPLALAGFTAAALLPWPLAGLKILLVAADLAACFLLLRLARTRGLPAGRTLWYAWSPLATVEVAGMAHVDALVVLAMVATVLALDHRRVAVAGAAAAAGVLAKLVPLVALPMWVRQSHRPWRFAAVAAALLVATLGPVVASTRGVPSGLVTYGVSWEFDGPLYEPLYRGYEALAVDDWVKARLDARKAADGRHATWNRLYPYVYPRLLAKLTLAALFACAVARSLGEGDAIAGTGRLLAALVLVSATVYPWYLLWVLPWAALSRHVAWLTVAASIQLSYLAQMDVVPLWPWLFAAIWLPFALLALGQRLLPPPAGALRRRSPWSIAC